MRRDVGLRSRESKKLPTQKLYDILSQIYPQETVERIMHDLSKNSNKKENEE